MGSLPLPSALRSRKAKEFWRACRRKSSRRRFNSMVPAFHRVHDAEGHIARRVIIRLLFDPFTVKWACAFVGCRFSLIRFLRTFGAASSARQLAKLAILLLLRLTDQRLEFSRESVSRLFGENVSSHSVSTGCGSPDDELAPKVRKNPFKRSSTAKPLAS